MVLPVGTLRKEIKQDKKQSGHKDNNNSFKQNRWFVAGSGIQDVSFILFRTHLTECNLHILVLLFTSELKPSTFHFNPNSI